MSLFENFTIISLFVSNSSGASGERKLVSKFSKEAIFVISIKHMDIIPIAPNMLDAMINENLQNLIPFIKSVSWNIRLDIDVMATTIIVIGETIEASTAACPSTRAPTILIAVVILLGLLISLSLSTSNTVINNIISKKVGKGTPSL